MLKLANQFLNVIFPPSCAGCGILIATNGTVCAHCWKNLRFITKPFCPIMGIPFYYEPETVTKAAFAQSHKDIDPIHTTNEPFLSIEAITNKPPFGRSRSVLIHDGLARNLVTRLKYGDHTELAGFMANWMGVAGQELIYDCDMIIPIPLHSRRFLKRNYNQAAELARNISKKYQKPMFPNILTRKRHTLPQVGLSKKQRQNNVNGAFLVPIEQKQQIKNRHVLLIDDVYTTGATVRSAASTLLKAGALHVDVLSFSRVLAHEHYQSTS